MFSFGLSLFLFLLSEKSSWKLPCHGVYGLPKMHGVSGGTLGIVIAAFISDRHTQIASHMKNVLSHIAHYFDLWHLKKSMINNNYFSLEYCLHCYLCIL